MLRDIRVESHCEHHMTPFLGVAHVAYLPKGRIVGISKIARVVEIFAKRLQTQETMTAQIADAIEAALMPRGVAVLIEAEHQCMSMRGVRQPGVRTITSRFTGAIGLRRQLSRPLPADGARPPLLRRPPSREGRPATEPGDRFMAAQPPPFAARGSPDEVETGLVFQPRFDADGLIPAIVTDAASGEVLMFAWMNAEALALTLETRIGHFWSRSRGRPWKKGEESGNLLRVSEVRTDCDQDVVWLKVAVEGAGVACHTGERSCFYRSLPLGGAARPRPSACGALNPFLTLSLSRRRSRAHNSRRCAAWHASKPAVNHSVGARLIPRRYG